MSVGLLGPYVIVTEIESYITSSVEEACDNTAIRGENKISNFRRMNEMFSLGSFEWFRVALSNPQLLRPES